MKVLSLMAISAILVLCVGCGSDGGYTSAVDDRNYTPYLEEFHIIDSLGNDTYDFTNPEPILSPFEDNGFFEIYWFVDSVEDYVVEYRINDIPSVDDSLLINFDFCGQGLDCDQDGIQFCQYFEDFTISCDSYDQDETYYLDLIDIMPEAPQTMYLILQVCDLDSNYCEYDYYPVLME